MSNHHTFLPSRFHSKLPAACLATALGCLSLLSSVQFAHAAAGGQVFGGTIGTRHYCEIIVTSPGQLALSPDGTEMSSKQASGSAGIAQITTTNASYWVVEVEAPTTFSTMPAGGDTGVTFSSAYSLSGATILPESPGTHAEKLKKGVTTLSAHFLANRTGSAFPPGNYSGVLTVRCE